MFIPTLIHQKSQDARLLGLRLPRVLPLREEVPGARRKKPLQLFRPEIPVINGYNWL